MAIGLGSNLELPTCTIFMTLSYPLQDVTDKKGQFSSHTHTHIQLYYIDFSYV